ncbi:MAG: hypothetical protein V4857_27845 [Pseudomonadota bacterium]
MTQELITDSRTEDAKQFARLLYVAHGLIIIFSLGMLSIVPLIINYVKRPDTVGTFVYSHHSWMIRTFWIYLIGWVIAVLLFITIIGIPFAWLLGAILWVWYCYRVIRGFIDLNNNRSMD